MIAHIAISAAVFLASAAVVHFATQEATGENITVIEERIKPQAKMIYDRIAPSENANMIHYKAGQMSIEPAPQPSSQAKVLEHILKGKPCQRPGYTRYRGKCYSKKNLGFVRKP